MRSSRKARVKYRQCLRTFQKKFGLSSLSIHIHLHIRSIMNDHFSRRRFLQVSGVALAGTALSPNLLTAAENYFKTKHIGLQLWSVRDDMKKDPAGTLKALAAMGYKEVESFGYDAQTDQIFGLTLKDFSKLLKDNGLKMPSSHSAIQLADYDPATKMLSDRAKKVIDSAASVGQKYLINPWTGDEDRKKLPELMKTFTAVGEYAKKAGIKFGYHNHDFEFKTKGTDGRVMYDWLLEEVDPKLMVMEMDIYWVQFAGFQALDYFKKYPGRFELCHAKDMSAADQHPSIEFGDGTIDFKSILAQRSKAGLKYVIVELENYLTTPMKGAQRSLDNLKALKV